jgi:hypothetical protein
MFPYFFHSNYNSIDAQKFKVHIHLTMYMFTTSNFFLPLVMVNHMFFFLLCICSIRSGGWHFVGDMCHGRDSAKPAFQHWSFQ